MIYEIRGKQVILDYNLAELYQIETGSLNRQMKRNKNRFPEDFCFQLTGNEYENLKCQIGISKNNIDNNHAGSRTFSINILEDNIVKEALINNIKDLISLYNT